MAPRASSSPEGLRSIFATLKARKVIFVDPTARILNPKVEVYEYYCGRIWAAMHMIYIDDSGQKESRRRYMGELISVGGVIVPEHAVAAFAADLDAIRAELEIPEGEEIKWKPPRNTFQASAGGELITELRQRMLQAAIDHGIKSAVVVWDRGHLPWEKTDVEPEILKYLYERITLHLRQHDDVGIIIADQPGGGRKERNEVVGRTPLA